MRATITVIIPVPLQLQYHNASIARRARYPLNDDDDDDDMRKNEQR